MNVADKVKDLYEHVQKAHELMQDLQSVDWSSVEAEGLEVGKLCKFSDYADFHTYIYGRLEKIKDNYNFPYYCSCGAGFRYCKRVTKKELEKML